MSSTVSVERHFEDYQPKHNVYDLTERMVSLVPDVYLNGLDRIVLRTGASMSRSQRRSRTKRKGRISLGKDALGQYHRPWQGQRAYIEIFVDRIDQTYDLDRNIYFLRNLVGELNLARILYHEIGHHIHRTKRLKQREPEGEADRYASYYSGKYVRRYHPILLHLFRSVRWFQSIFKPTLRANLVTKRRRRQEMEQSEAEAIASHERRLADQRETSE